MENEKVTARAIIGGTIAVVGRDWFGDDEIDFARK